MRIAAETGLSELALGDPRQAAGDLKEAVKLAASVEERVSPLRAETGVENQPPSEERAPAAPRARGDDERTWRTEARRVATEAGRLRDKAADLRSRAQEQREKERDRPLRKNGPSASRGRAAERLEEQARRAEQRAAALETDLWERARRARALPGWLR